MAVRRDVEFKSGGTLCRAWLYVRQNTGRERRPCIVMAPGLSGTRECSLEPFALRFAQAGFCVLLFDYRGFGASDGKPPQVVRISDELADWHTAIAFARSLPGVDPTRIGLWGTSLSGGHVISVAAQDPTIAAIASQCPMLDGRASSRMYRRSVGVRSMLRLAGAALRDVAHSMFGMQPYYVPLVAPQGQFAVMATHDAYPGLMAITPPGWRNEVAARLFLSLPHYRPVRTAKKVTCPALLISCSKDSVTSHEAAAKAAANMKGRVRHLELPIGHFDIYRGEWFETASEVQVEFFTQALRSEHAA
jgi:pimeloyl-ACP methyl ester carboxylesterase